MIFSHLIRTRKFQILAFDSVMSIALFFLAKYGTPSLLEDVKFIIVILQPAVMMAMGSIAYEDSQKAHAEANAEITKF